ncbi:MAG: hypothetical protein ACFFCS_07870 [Candidatus Hodarchaeota archaeon]
MKHPFMQIEGMKPASDALDQATLEKIEQIKQNVMKKVKPSGSEIDMVSGITSKVIAALDRALKDNGIKFDFIEPQGSTGIKQTQLAGDSDVDLFIGLNQSIFDGIEGPSQKERKKKFKRLINTWINDIITPAVKNHLSPEKILFSYAEHPYLTIAVDKVKFDVVFCFNISSERIQEKGLITAMDRTPLHSKFVRDELSKEQKDNVRLLKAFFKAQHVYGDKSATGRMGFIGYGIEIMMHFFGTMENLMVNFSTLKDTPLDVFGREGKKLRENKRFENDTLIIIDPTDKERNVGSSTDERALKYANHVIQQFLENPSEKFFVMEEIAAPENKDPRLFSVVFKNEQEVHYTIVRDKLYRLGNAVKNALEKEPTNEPKFGEIIFEVILGPGESPVAMGFFVKNPTITTTYTRRGPHSSDEAKRVRGFLEKHPNATIDDEGYYIIQVDRYFSEFHHALADFISKNLDIKGVSPIRGNKGEIDVNNNPVDKIGKQSLHILRQMVIPFIK